MMTTDKRKLTREGMTRESEALRTRTWKDEELRSIPEDLLPLAFEQSDTLRDEFGSIASLMAYRRAREQGLARIHVEQTRS